MTMKTTLTDSLDTLEARLQMLDGQLWMLARIIGECMRTDRPLTETGCAMSVILTAGEEVKRLQETLATCIQQHHEDEDEYVMVPVLGVKRAA